MENVKRRASGRNRRGANYDFKNVEGTTGTFALLRKRVDKKSLNPSLVTRPPPSSLTRRRVPPHRRACRPYPPVPSSSRRRETTGSVGCHDAVPSSSWPLSAADSECALSPRPTSRHALPCGPRPTRLRLRPFSSSPRLPPASSGEGRGRPDASSRPPSATARTYPRHRTPVSRGRTETASLKPQTARVVHAPSRWSDRPRRRLASSAFPQIRALLGVRLEHDAHHRRCRLLLRQRRRELSPRRVLGPNLIESSSTRQRLLRGAHPAWRPGCGREHGDALEVVAGWTSQIHTLLSRPQVARANRTGTTRTTDLVLVPSGGLPHSRIRSPAAARGGAGVGEAVARSRPVDQWRVEVGSSG